MNGTVRRSQTALSAEIDDEVVALDVARGLCYGLDSVGARIWEMIDQPTTLEAVCARLVLEYDVDAETCRKDVLDLFADLRAEGLIQMEPAPPAEA